ncbi:hypothetical protein GCK72_007479 [Caenorhabditis remanei]|uniref:Uncharacterized protein n=1 Tax=Caenorhabditis remanei TaxID=31234 RepID=A0A6A5HHF2_CAERE|nr:hypothetical protein GCK72_007479 [Caenorhabditis remanei]KAF1767520.1 hypothetical protein GCK72_007479 [Caenorhabditis remanei]
MNHKPLQYESLKAVLLYMDANVRFRISHRLPSIRSVEKIVPLKIRYLYLDEFLTIVNDHIYRFGVYREYNSGEEVPKLIQDDNDKGGAQHDIDRYGFQISPGHSVLDPGDVLLEDLRDVIHYDTPEQERALEAEVNRFEKAIFLLNNPEEVEDPPEEYENDDAAIEALMLADAMKLPLESLKTHLEYSRTDFLPFECRRYNREPPYTCYIQLTVDSPSGKRIHRLPYRKKLYEVVKRFNTLLFGGRPSTLKVFRFQLETFQTVLRLPVGFQVNMKYLSSSRGFRGPYNGVISMIDPACISLAEIQIHVYRESDLEYPFIRSAKKLIIQHTSRRREMIPALINLPNHLISLVCTDPEFTAEDYFELVQNWRNNDRPVGSCFSIGIQQEVKPVNALFQMMTERWEETKRNDRYASIPTRNGNILEVLYEPKEEPRSRDQWEFLYPDNWIFRARIIERE